MTVLVESQRGTSTERLLRSLLAMAAAQFLVLAGSGLFLVFFYRPPAKQGWSNLASEAAGDRTIEAVRLLHRVMAGALTLTLVVVAVFGVVALVRRGFGSRRRPAASAAGIGLGVAGVLAVFTGYWLAWDQLFLFAEKVAGDIRGFRLFIWHPSVIEHATVRGSDASIGSLRLWLLAHVVVIPLGVIALGVLATGHRFGRWSDREGLAT